MSEAIEILKREIAKRQAEIDALQTSLDILSGKAPLTGKQLPAPEKRRRQRTDDAEGGTFTVNGIDLDLTAGEWPVANAINDSEDCCSVDLLQDLCGGKLQNVHNRIYSINQKLKTAGAHIVHFKGEGYRLQNIEEGA